MATTLETLSHDLATAAATVGRTIVAVHARRRIPASGILWRAGVIVATHHTVHKDDDIRITLDGGATARAAVIGRDAGTDLVVLKLDQSPNTPEIGPAATIAREPLRVGQLALALGRPGDAVTAALGVVSAIGPAWRSWHGGEIDQFVRLDVAVYDGFSGGPLVDATGRVLGVNTSALARAAAVTVPATTVDRVVDQLLAGGRVRRGYLGIGTQPVRLPDAVRASLDASSADASRADASGADASGRGESRGGQQTGLMLVALEPGAPAEQAGLLLGDVLVTLGGRPTEDVDDVLGALGGAAAGVDLIGQTIDARVLRAGELRTVPVTVGEAPARR